MTDSTVPPWEDLPSDEEEAPPCYCRHRPVDAFAPGDRGPHDHDPAGGCPTVPYGERL